LNNIAPVVGHIVISKVGRDQGKTYLVVGTSGDHKLLLADGRKKTLAHPKAKNPRHLKILHFIAEGSAELGKVNDLTIRAALANISPDKL
jgi:ribosomal protein L14E/L6E/L27E